MKPYCALDLTIDGCDVGRYRVSARFLDPVTDTENDLLDPIDVAIDLNVFR
jgi:hypothetical protein